MIIKRCITFQITWTTFFYEMKWILLLTKKAAEIRSAYITHNFVIHTKSRYLYKFVLWLFHGFQLTIKLNKLNCISSPLLEYAKLTCLMKDSNMVDSLVLPKIPCMNTTALWDWAIMCPSTQVHKIKPQEKVDLLNLCIIKTEST